jgi:hypothetical protein
MYPSRSLIKLAKIVANDRERSHLCCSYYVFETFLCLSCMRLKGYVFQNILYKEQEIPNELCNFSPFDHAHLARLSPHESLTRVR